MNRCGRNLHASDERGTAWRRVTVLTLCIQGLLNAGSLYHYYHHPHSLQCYARRRSLPNQTICRRTRPPTRIHTKHANANLAGAAGAP